MSVLLLGAAAGSSCSGKAAGKVADAGLEHPDSTSAVDAAAEVAVDTFEVRVDGFAGQDTATDLAVDRVEVKADSSVERDLAVDASDLKPDDAVLADASTDARGDPVAWIDAQGEAGILPECSGDPSVPLWDNRYVCGTCESDLFYALACVDGHLACSKSYVGSDGKLVNVPVGQYVLSASDFQNKTGLCAYVATYTYPGFALADPALLDTDRALGAPLVLKAVSSTPSVKPTFDWLQADRPNGERVIHSLVTLTDMTNKASVTYTIGDPSKNNTGSAETLSLQPTALAAKTWYRVTIFPAETQSSIKYHTFDRLGTAWLAVPETTDFYTYSRPMVGTMAIVAKDGGKGYLIFSFTEALLGTELAAYPMTQVFVDGADVSSCMMPYPCSGSASAEAYDLRLDLPAAPASFSEIAMRIPHAIKSSSGGSILDGTVGNRSAKIEGDWTVYTFKSADMTVTQGGAVKRWYYTGP